MSWDIDLIGKIDGNDVYLGDWNYTSNAWDFLTPLINKIGIPDFTISGLNGKTAKECIPILKAILLEIVEHKMEYEKYNPKNGWGSVETFIPFWQSFYDECCKYPSAIISTFV